MSIDLNLEPLEATLGAGALIVNDYRITTEPIEGGHRLNITRGSEVQTMDVLDGVGIVGIEKTGSTGDVDSYRVSFTDGSTFDYTVETNAATYAAAEAARAEAEAARESAETARASAESARAQAEDGRQSAEAARVAAEQSRASAESVRAAAENARVAAETARANAENERAGAETLRSAAETDRANAESGRVSAEHGRVSAESERVAAEEARATEFAGFSGEINQLKDDMATKADKAALTRTDRSLDALWKLNQGISYRFETYSEEAYQKQVISGAKLADIQSVGGKTVVWNQNIDTSNFRNTTIDGITFTLNTDGTISITGGFTGSTGSAWCQLSNYNNIPVGHKILVCGHGTDTNIRVYDGTTFFRTYEPTIITLASEIVNIFIGIDATKIDTVCAPRIIDLTQLFGAGNEPTTLDDSRIAWTKQYAAAHPEYNAGELVSAGVESIKYNDAIISDIPASVRALPGYGWSAGSAYNSIEHTDSGWQYVQRVGSVDLGTLYWTKYHSADSVFYASIPDRKPNDNNILSSIYTTDKSSNPPAAVPDKQISGYYSGYNVWVQDTNYTNGETFKTAMNGVMLYYELAKPIITPITEDMLEPFEVESGGTITYENAAKLSIPNSVEYVVSLAGVNS